MKYILFILLAELRYPWGDTYKPKRMNVWQVSMDVAIVTFQEEKGNKHKTHPNVNSEVSPTFHRGQIPVQNR